MLEDPDAFVEINQVLRAVVDRFAVSQDAGAPSASNNGVSADSYQTTGSASPAETRRMAEELLAGLPQQS